MMDAQLITYEYPFNERIRILLRLEDLQEKYRFFLNGSHPQEHQIALATLFDILDVVGRADLKSDLLQELERQRQILFGFKKNPHIEEKVLDSVIEELETVSADLQAAQGRTGQNIRENDWLMSIRGRMVIAGGLCEFDVPSFYAWLHQPVETRRADIDAWFEPFKPLMNALCFILRLLRDSGNAANYLAEKGAYQEMLHGKTYQIVRLTLDKDLHVIPEISVNKYMVLVRFTMQEGKEKPRSYEGDVPFELTLCNF